MSSTSRLSIQYSLLSNSQSHLDACPLYPVECPNMCGEMAVPREKVHSNPVEVLTNINLCQVLWIIYFVTLKWSSLWFYLLLVHDKNLQLSTLLSIFKWLSSFKISSLSWRYLTFSTDLVQDIFICYCWNINGVEKTQGKLQFTKVYYNPSVIGVDRTHYFGDFR